MIIYDVTDRQSFIEVEGWIKTIHECVPTDIPIIIIGNKIDLDTKSITTEEGKERKWLINTIANSLKQVQK